MHSIYLASCAPLPKVPSVRLNLGPHATSGFLWFSSYWGKKCGQWSGLGGGYLKMPQSQHFRVTGSLYLSGIINITSRSKRLPRGGPASFHPRGLHLNQDPHFSIQKQIFGSCWSQGSIRERAKFLQGTVKQAAWPDIMYVTQPRDCPKALLHQRGPKLYLIIMKHQKWTLHVGPLPGNFAINQFSVASQGWEKWSYQAHSYI